MKVVVLGCLGTREYRGAREGILILYFKSYGPKNLLIFQYLFQLNRI